MRLTGAEWHVMNALWQEWPATAREVQARLPKDIDWAYTTIRSVLARLNEKGALKEYKRSSVSFYEPILSKRKARMATLQSVVGDAFEGAFGPLMHFLVEEEALSDAEKQKLLDVLTEKEGEGAGDE
jgi:BlaI family transcriptional regulator, penicillinase repressor